MGEIVYQEVSSKKKTDRLAYLQYILYLKQCLEVCRRHKSGKKVSILFLNFLPFKLELRCKLPLCLRLTTLS